MAITTTPMSNFVISHPGFPSPILITDEERELVIQAMNEQRSHVVFADMILPISHLMMTPQDLYRQGYERDLKPSRRYVCPWGNLHENSDTGEHSQCKASLSTRNPLVATAQLAAIAEPKVALPAA